jgi:hypothetical protein
MSTIVITLRKDTKAGDIGAALKEICSIQEVFNVQAVYPADAAAGRGLHYTADLTENADKGKVLEAVKAAPFVQGAYVPPLRKLL